MTAIRKSAGVMNSEVFDIGKTRYDQMPLPKVKDFVQSFWIWIFPVGHCPKEMIRLHDMAVFFNITINCYVYLEYFGQKHGHVDEFITIHFI